MTLGPADFEGTWDLVRVITDRLSGQDGNFGGTAVFAPDASGLLYREDGTLRLQAGPSFKAQRAYHWAFVADRVDVTFPDGGAFHSFTPSGAAAGTDHPCGADFYQVAYDFTHWPDWSATWQVSGPRKDYTSVSRYRRQRSCS